MKTLNFVFFTYKFCLIQINRGDIKRFVSSVCDPLSGFYIGHKFSLSADDGHKLFRCLITIGKRRHGLVKCHRIRNGYYLDCPFFGIILTKKPSGHYFVQFDIFSDSFSHLMNSRSYNYMCEFLKQS